MGTDRPEQQKEPDLHATDAVSGDLHGQARDLGKLHREIRAHAVRGNLDHSVVILAHFQLCRLGQRWREPEAPRLSVAEEKLLSGHDVLDVDAAPAAHGVEV